MAGRGGVVFPPSRERQVGAATAVGVAVGLVQWLGWVQEFPAHGGDVVDGVVGVAG